MRIEPSVMQLNRPMSDEDDVADNCYQVYLKENYLLTRKLTANGSWLDVGKVKSCYTFVNYVEYHICSYI